MTVHVELPDERRRRAVDDELVVEARPRVGFVGLGASGVTDTATNHRAIRRDHHARVSADDV